METSQRMWGLDVESNVRDPREGQHYQRAMRCVSLPKIEEDNVTAMSDVELHYGKLCQNHFGRKPHKQSFGRWHMERGLHQNDDCVVPALTETAPLVSPCMRREIRELLPRPPTPSPLMTYKAYFKRVEVQLAKRSDKIKGISPMEAGILLNKMPACLKLIESNSGCTPKTLKLKLVQEDCEKVVDAVEPIAEKVVLCDAETISADVSRFADSQHKTIAAKRSEALIAAGVSSTELRGSAGASQPHACSPPLTWNRWLSEAKSTASNPLSARSARDMGGVKSRGDGPTCGRHIDIQIPAGRGWAAGERLQERQRIQKRLKQANSGPCDSCVANAPAIPLVPCQVQEKQCGKRMSVSSDGVTSAISLQHFNKLRYLYKMTCAKFDPKLEYFPQRLLCMLKRYEALFGDMSAINLQGALPLKLYECLHNRLGVTMECFASPLNCYFPQYCSMFGDTDCVFGSRGSFYTFEPEEGSLSVNPPFCEEVLDKVAVKLEGLLDATSRPLSFCITIPEWRDPPTAGAVKLDKSRFLQRHFLVKANDHQYRRGNQHLLVSESERVFTANFATEVFVMQNEAGARKWPVTDDLVAAVQNTFDRSPSSPGRW